jgi:hypothetical protein
MNGQLDAQANAETARAIFTATLPDYVELVRAAEAGDVAKQGKLGSELLWAGIDSYLNATQDPRILEGMKWLEMACEGGHLGAMHELGLFYWFGHGGEDNKARAIDYFRRADEKDYFPSTIKLAETYEQGDVVKANYPEAMRLYLRGFALAASSEENSKNDFLRSCLDGIGKIFHTVSYSSLYEKNDLGMQIFFDEAVRSFKNVELPKRPGLQPNGLILEKDPCAPSG